MRSGGADYRDEARTEHMFRAIGCIRKLLPGVTRESLDEWDPVTQQLIYNIQLIGEDANNLSDDFCCAHPEIDARGWSGLRHRLIHDYANIDFGIVWNVLQCDIPQLEKALNPIVAAQPSPPELPDNLDDFI